jgi:hypothetical protein
VANWRLQFIAPTAPTRMTQNTSVREDVLGLVPGTVWLSTQTVLLKKLTVSKARFRTKFRLADHLAAKRNR